MRNSIFLLSALALSASAAPRASPSPQKGVGGAGGCKKVAFIFARGSTEASLMGSSVGPAMQRALEAKFPGQVKTMGVKYPASIQGAMTGAMNPSDAEGSKDMTAKVKETWASCPDTKIILCGYSQGAEQVHGALQRANLGQDGGKIAAAITYGDPMAGERTKALGGWGCLPEDRTKVFCNSGDGVCTGAFSISGAHLSYTTNGDIAKGAAFAAQVISGGAIKGVEGECKYGISGFKGAGGAGGASAKGSGGGGTKGTAGAKGAGGSGGGLKGVPKGKGKGTGGTGESSAAPPAAAEPAPAAPAAEAAPPAAEDAAAGRYIVDMVGMPGMS